MKRLKIRNLILIEQADIAFGPHLNILTGETGSGKSAILMAIRLLTGERADAGLIRQGADLAIVEALLDGDVWVRREVYRSGKSRAFIDDEQVNLAALKEKVDIERVDASGNETEMLDTFAGLLTEVKELKLSEEEAATLRLSAMSHSRERIERDWELIQSVGLKPNEEAKLTEEHNRLSHAQDLLEKMGGALSIIEEQEGALKRALGQIDSCARLDASLTPLFGSLKGALLELDEVKRGAGRYLDQIEIDPNRLIAVEKRLSAIELLKKRFEGKLDEKIEELKKEMASFAELDFKLASLAEREARNGARREAITQQRKIAAPRFAERVRKELRELNMPHAQFEIDVGSEVKFLFSANPGLPPLPLKECASSGEFARLILSMKTVLAEGSSTLVFDEIDSNIGGQTAAILGEKLKGLSHKRQIICVTHFVQVAKCAIDHFLVAKETSSSHSTTVVTKLDEKEKAIEYDRMMGQKR